MISRFLIENRGKRGTSTKCLVQNQSYQMQSTVDTIFRLQLWNQPSSQSYTPILLNAICYQLHTTHDLSYEVIRILRVKRCFVIHSDGQICPQNCRTVRESVRVLMNGWAIIHSIWCYRSGPFLLVLCITCYTYFRQVQQKRYYRIHNVDPSSTTEYDTKSSKIGNIHCLSCSYRFVHRWFKNLRSDEMRTHDQIKNSFFLIFRKL